MTPLAGWTLGLLLGMRHACEPDHLAAISTLASESPGPRKGLLLGAFWGIGHTASLFAVAVALTVLQSALPQRLADGFELLVAFMLLTLGARAVMRAAREGERGPVHAHSHFGSHDPHVHAAPGQHVHFGRSTLALRPLFIGLIHGLAGSGALTALAMAALPDSAQRLWYVLLFGLGSVLGMAALSGVAGWPLASLGRRPRALRALAASTGLFSIVLGAFWGYPLLTRVFPL